LTTTSRTIVATAIATLPLLVYANSGTVFTPQLKRTGAAVDGGLNCTACHVGAAANSDPRGKLTISTANYKPGVQQTIRVKLEHPEAQRWGFELTARALNDETKSVSVLKPDENNRTQRAACDSRHGVHELTIGGRIRQGLAP